MKVLVVEDDIGLAERLAKSLQANHYQVEFATDGDSGLSLTRTFAEIYQIQRVALT